MLLISKNKTSTEFNLLRKNAQKKSAPEKKDMALAAYLLGHANLKKVIDGPRPLLISLQKANDSTNCTHQKLSYGWKHCKKAKNASGDLW